MTDSKQNKWVSSWAKIFDVFRHSIGTLLVFVSIHYLLMTFVILPLLSRLWGLALHTTPDGYITESNFAVIFSCPLVLLAGAFIAVIYALAVFWQTSGIVTALEWAWRGRPISILGLFPASFQNMSEAVKPKNWGMMVYAVLAVPFASSYSLSNTIQSIAIPEYILSFIINKFYLAIPLCIGVFFLFLFVIKRMPVSFIFIIEGNTSREATKKSLRIMKGHVIKSTLLQLLISVVASVLFIYLPRLISILLRWGIGQAYGSSAIYKASARLMIGNFITPAIQMLGSGMVMILVMIYILWLYHRYNDEPELSLDNPVFAGRRWASRHPFPFHTLLPIVYAAVIAAQIIMVCWATAAFTDDPSAILSYIPSVDIIAHRGYDSVAPENTIPAFRSAIESGVVDYIELDVHPSRDGIPVVIHDSNTKRTTGFKADVSSLWLSEIEKLDAGSSFSKDFAGTKIPTLEEVLQYCKDKMPLIVEIKNHSHLEGFEQKVVDLIKEYGCEDTCVIHSLSYESLVKVKEADPDMPCGLIMAIATGAYYDLPCADFFCVESTFVNSEMVRQIHARNKLVYAWTVNDESNATSLLEKGVDGLITDEPVAMYKVVHNYSEDLETYLYDLLPLYLKEDLNSEESVSPDAA